MNVSNEICPTFVGNLTVQVNELKTNRLQMHKSAKIMFESHDFDFDHSNNSFLFQFIESYSILTNCFSDISHVET